MPKTFKFLKWHGKKAVALLVLTVMLAVGTVGATIAFIVTQTDEWTNVFEPAKVNSTVNGNVITNNSETSVYARAAVVLTWVSTTDGTTLATPPAENDYSITYNTAEGWFQAGGFWYYKYELAAGATAPALLTVDAVLNAPEGYKLSVEILSSVIQSNPATAITSSWPAVNVSVENNQTVLVPKS